MDTKAAEAMKTAIDMEKSGHAFFKDAASKVKSEIGRKVFLRLAAEELVHLQVFEKIFNEVTKGTEWKKAVEAAQPTKPVPYFDEARKQFKAEDLTAELDFLEKALDLERKAIHFFEKAIEEAETPEAKEIFRRILKEEEQHYDFIQSEIDSLNRSGFWLDVKEFYMDGKF